MEKRRPVHCVGGHRDHGVSGHRTRHTFGRTQEASAVSDPRQEPPIVRLATAAPVTGSRTRLHGRHCGQGAEQSRFPRCRQDRGTACECRSAGQSRPAADAGRDEADLRLALTAKRNAVAAARASVVQADADERRYAKLVSNGWSTRQRYEQAKAALILPRRNTPPPRPTHGSRRTRRPTRSCWRTRMERWLKHLASRGRSSPPARQ